MLMLWLWPPLLGTIRMCKSHILAVIGELLLDTICLKIRCTSVTSVCVNAFK